eukprot:CAMPEP_0172470806 /NCGR_PEP_ID=MMETSP1065-20121228/67325_1 /TAXON_ID=265537 /ORGANISM="Amphiprora paludosa, Strain CCMP125" /LENGTH=73 /DNA_ID=CAMNT_0013228851 /DNA_START=80 /DNA_END=301 /DNA_ORIENTATION=-
METAPPPPERQRQAEAQPRTKRAYETVYLDANLHVVQKLGIPDDLEDDELRQEENVKQRFRLRPLKRARLDWV